LKDGVEVVVVTGGRGCLPLQSRTLATTFIVITIILLLGNVYIGSIACRQLSAPKMGDVYFLLMEWDAERAGLLH